MIVTITGLGLASFIQAQTSPQHPAESTHVPRNSWLFGVSVQNVTLTDIQARNTGYPSSAGAGHAVVITSVGAEEGTPAAIGQATQKPWLRIGDIVTVIINEGVRPERDDFKIMYSMIGTPTAERFYELAAQCTTECLVGVVRDFETPEDTIRNGLLLVGGRLLTVSERHGMLAPIQPGLKFSYIFGYDRLTGYKDKGTGLVYESAYGGFLATKERATLADESKSGIVYTGPWGTPVDWNAELHPASQGGRTLQTLPVQANGPSFPMTNTPPSVNDDVQQEIQKIRNSQHASMPPAQAVPAALGGQMSVTVENGTPYILHVYLAGAVNRELDITTGTSQTLQLPPGHYEVAARVSNKAVIPFYGTEDYAPNTDYSSHFYIATQRR